MGESENDAADRREANNRLWQHAVHEDTMLFQRGNLYLLAQSLQVVAYTSVVSSTGQSATGAHASLIAARVIAAFGIALTVNWLYVGHRHLRYTQAVHRHARARFVDYAEIRSSSRQRGPSHVPLIVYALPLMAGAMWLTLLVLT